MKGYKIQGWLCDEGIYTISLKGDGIEIKLSDEEYKQWKKIEKEWLKWQSRFEKTVDKYNKL